MICTRRVSICTVFNTESTIFLTQSCTSSCSLFNGSAHYLVPGQRPGDHSRILSFHHPWQSMIITKSSWCRPKYSLNPFPFPYSSHRSLSTGPHELLQWCLTWVPSRIILVKSILHVAVIVRYLKCKPSFISTMPKFPMPQPYPL